LALHVAGVIFLLALLPDGATNGEAFATAVRAAGIAQSVCGVLGTILALVGIGYCAIASHRREWGAVLVIAWVLSVLGVFFDPFLFVAF
jgi:hypothetical protein